MANSKHTPGPWRLGIEGTVVADSEEGLTIGGATGKENTDYYGGNLICESISMANAKLTAAAPEMLATLMTVCSRLAGVDDALRSYIEDLIKKAT